MRVPVLLASLAIVAAAGCARPVEPVPRAEAIAASLLELPFATLSIPSDSRDGRPPTEVALIGGWRPITGSGERQRWEAPLPVRPRNLFFFAPPRGMSVVDPSGELVPHTRYAEHDEGRWAFTRATLMLDLPRSAPAPSDGGYHVTWPRASAREAALNRAWSEAQSDREFVVREAFDGQASRAGLLLPAPATVAWDLTVPPAAELRFSAGLLPPELDDLGRSDGARLTVEVEVGGRRARLLNRPLHPAAGFRPTRLDLSRWAGQAVRLHLGVEPGRTATLDYAFVADPILASRPTRPRRVAVVFVDTLRPDHLGLYGHHRDTSPALDRWATDAVVFDAARSVAPWTLPTARALVTGHHPEVYDHVATLPARFRRSGYASAFFGGNVYLSTNFDMGRDWGVHQVEHKPSARTQVDRAIAWLDAHDGQDTFLMLHFMDAHLPYEEPIHQRQRWAGPAPTSLSDRFTRIQVLSTDLGDEERAYIVDRYDQTIRYIDTHLARLLDRFDDDDIVVFLSDHGEEFWEHGDFEHGHTLYDEVMRVPLIVRAPGLTPGRIREPVSLLDVAPTLMTLAGLPNEGLTGADLGPALRDEAGARSALAERDLAFGRPLYGPRQWGAVRGHEKYTTQGPVERLYHLDTDPDERVDRLVRDVRAAPELRERLAAALGTEVHAGLRVLPEIDDLPYEASLTVRLRVSGGIAHAFVGDDPTGPSTVELEIDEDTVTATWPRRTYSPREIFVVPTRPLADVLRAGEAPLELIGRWGATLLTPRAPLRPDRPLIGVLAHDTVRVRLDRAVIPLPIEGAEALRAFDDELSEMLEALGYTVGDP